jgi:hypothetical protein
MPEVRFDSYPAVRLERPASGTPGVILNALDGTIIREGVTLWSGGVATAQPEAQPPGSPTVQVPSGDPQEALKDLAREYFEQLSQSKHDADAVQANLARYQELKRLLEELKQRKSQERVGALRAGALRSGPVSVIRNSVCDAHGEVYGRVLESVPVITLVEPR